MNNCVYFKTVYKCIKQFKNWYNPSIKFVQNPWYNGMSMLFLVKSLSHLCF